MRAQLPTDSVEKIIYETGTTVTACESLECSISTTEQDLILILGCRTIGTDRRQWTGSPPHLDREIPQLTQKTNERCCIYAFTCCNI